MEGGWIRTRLIAACAAALMLLVASGACAGSRGEPANGRGVKGEECREPEGLVLEIVRALPHDPEAFTQGLLWYDGALFESTGHYGRSELRRIDPESGEIRNRSPLPAELFGEGLARAGDRLIQLTWQAGKALVWDLETFEARGDLSYAGEGWGLCYDGRKLIRSDGSDILTFHDAETFAETGRVEVRLKGRSLSALNELECVDGEVWANVWRRDLLVRIDPETGDVTATVDATGLLPPDERRQADVLNGIAYRPDTDTFFLTGKYWRTIFEVRLAKAWLEGELER